MNQGIISHLTSVGVALIIAGVTFLGLYFGYGILLPQSYPHIQPSIKGGVLRDDVDSSVLNEQLIIISTGADSVETIVTTGAVFSPHSNTDTGDVDDVGSGDNSNSSIDSNLFDLESEIDGLLGSHYSAGVVDYRNQLERLCASYSSICSIISLDGSYDSKKQYTYHLMISYIITKLTDRGYNPMQTLQSITVNNYTKNKRGYANAKLIVLNTYQMKNSKEFLQVLVHEMGHVIDLGALQGSSSQRNTSYTEFGKVKFSVDDPSIDFYAISWINEDTMRSRMSSLDFVSGYGMTNPFEDFAECHNMYIYHREIFVYLASTSTILKQKYDYFDRLYQSHYLSPNFNEQQLSMIDITHRPWDTTRM